LKDRVSVIAVTKILWPCLDLSYWTDLTNAPFLNLTNLQNEVTLPFSGGKSFYGSKTP
jgi:hypothetical protein